MSRMNTKPKGSYTNSIFQVWCGKLQHVLGLQRSNLNADISLKCDEHLCISVAEEPTMDLIAVVFFLISHLCWRKPKWKWHHFQRICNSCELKTIRPLEHVILCLRGWARNPRVQTGLRSVFAWASVCVGAPWEVHHDEKSSPDEKSKWVLFSVDRRTFVYSCCFSAGTHRHTHASVIVRVSVCLQRIVRLFQEC